MTNREHI